MQKSITDKLSRFNPQRPYVWELKITEDEFSSLEKDLCGYTPDESNKEEALKILVYLAEWYKRRYTNRAKKDYQKTFGGRKPNLDIVWTTLSIDDRYLYRGENGQKLYLYSTFILSGLAVKFERQKNEKPFLRALCRIYNEEDVSFDRIVDSNHSIAFKESVVQKHCLRDFLEAIIASKDNLEALPYAKDDYDNPETEVALLVELIREINSEVNKSKFRFEWIVSSIPGDNLITRRLRIWLNPEEKGKRHQLLNIDRLKKWGFAEPENMCYIRIGVRYWDGKNVIKEPNFHRPDIYYRNTGNESVGFICENVDYVSCNKVPIQHFDKIQLISWNVDGTELPIPILEEDVDFNAMQLYRLEEGEDDWTSRVNNQKETSLLFSDKWIVANSSIDKDFERKSFYNSKIGEGYSVSWCYIHTSVTIECEDKSRTYYNRQGYDHIIAKRYNDTIDYTVDGKVLFHYAEDEDSPETITPISLIFGKQDIIAYHTETKDGEIDTCEDTEIQLCEFKKRENYTPWTEIETPEFGYVELRLTIKGKQTLFKAFYLPKPIVRNLESNTIHYHNITEELVYDDKAYIEESIRKRQVLKPTITLNIGSKNSYVSAPIYRPVRLKEVCYDGNVLMYDDDGKVNIPYILKEYIEIKEFGEKGYCLYQCKLFRNIFKDINNSNYRFGGKYTSAIDGKEFIDKNAPVGVTFFVRKSLSKNPHYKYCYWDCKKGSTPSPIRDIKTFNLLDGCVLFQDQRRVSKRLQCEYMEKDAKGFAKIIRKGNDESIPAIDLFSIASEYNQYFFHFKGLRMLANGILDGSRDFYEEIFNPLLENHKDKFSNRDKNELFRFADEFCLENLKKELIEKITNIL